MMKPLSDASHRYVPRRQAATFFSLPLPPIPRLLAGRRAGVEATHTQNVDNSKKRVKEKMDEKEGKSIRKGTSLPPSPYNWNR